MKLTSKEARIRKYLDILGCMYPFSKLASRERDVFAEYINGYLELKGSIPKDKIFLILFGYDFTRSISDKLSSKENPVSMDTVRNYTTKLRKRGLLKEKSIEDKFILLFENLGETLTFNLPIIDNNDSTGNSK